MTLKAAGLSVSVSVSICENEGERGFGGGRTARDAKAIVKVAEKLRIGRMPQAGCWFFPSYSFPFPSAYP